MRMWRIVVAAATGVTMTGSTPAPADEQACLQQCIIYGALVGEAHYPQTDKDKGSFAGSFAGVIKGNPVPVATVTGWFSYEKPDVTCPRTGEGAGELTVVDRVNGATYSVSFSFRRVSASLTVGTFAQANVGLFADTEQIDCADGDQGFVVGWAGPIERWPSGSLAPPGLPW